MPDRSKEDIAQHHTVDFWTAISAFSSRSGTVAGMLFSSQSTLPVGETSFNASPSGRACFSNSVSKPASRKASSPASACRSSFPPWSRFDWSSVEFEDGEWDIVSLKKCCECEAARTGADDGNLRRGRHVSHSVRMLRAYKVCSKIRNPPAYCISVSSLKKHIQSHNGIANKEILEAVIPESIYSQNPKTILHKPRK